MREYYGRKANSPGLSIFVAISFAPRASIGIIRKTGSRIGK